MLLAFHINIVCVAEVFAFGAASEADETVYGLAFAQGTADAELGLVNGNLCQDDEADVEVLGIDDFLGCGHCFVDSGMQR